MEHVTDHQPRWRPHPLVAALLRGFVLITPIAASVAFVHVASGLVAQPHGALLPRVAWWLGIAVCATGVLIAFDRLTRKLLPLAALLKLALVFPDEAPSRFKTALAAGTAADLEARLAEAKAGASTETPIEAAERLLGFVAALSAHDHLTRGHSERVRAYSQMIAKELRLSRAEVDCLNWAALLHDVGKLEVPAEILNKPGRLSDDEWRQIRLHPELGARLAEPLRAWLGEWTDAIADHHERWDGTGYPAAAAGEGISLGGRIVAVADVFDVVTSSRSYKESGSAVDGREEIARCAGTQFDPRVVRAFLTISLGRLRFAMGPLSWLAQAPLLGRIPLAPGLVTVASSAVAVVGSVAAGFVGGAHVPTSFAAPAQAAATHVIAQVSRGGSIATVAAPGHHGGHARRVLAPAPTPPSARPLLKSALLVAPANPLEPAAGPADTPAASPPVVQSPVADPPPPAPPIAPSPVAPVAPAAPVVLPVNHAPAFTGGSDQTVFENAGPQTVPGWATAISRGPADEAGQILAFTATSGDPSLFAPGGGPRVAADGTLSYTPAAGAHGVTTVTVQAVDDGGTANGGVDTSAPQTLSITIVNRRPTATADAPSVLENDPAGVTFDVLANDADPEGDPLTIASFDASTIAYGGLTHNAGGSFTYVPATHFAGSDTFSYTVSDGNGGTSTAAVTITITPVPDPPAVSADAYVTSQGVALVEPAPGVLGNDADSSGGALSVATAPVVAPAHGTLGLAADGSFTYTPAPGFTGSDSFTYRATSAATSLSADAVVTITVPAAFSSTSFFLTGSGISSEVWNLSTSSPANSLLGIVPDYDGDLFPGLTIKSSDDSDSGDARRSQTWRYPLASALVLNGPVVLHLTSSGHGTNVAGAYLYDCTAGGASCTKIGFGSLSSHGLLGLGIWVSHDITVGTVNRTLPAGHELRLRLYSGSGDMWVAMTGDLPSTLTLTVP